VLRGGEVPLRPAEAALGNLYNLGLGVPANQAQAYAWTSLAAANGNKDAHARLALMTNPLSAADKIRAEQEVATVMAKRSAPTDRHQVFWLIPTPPATSHPPRQNPL